ncbi:hypothetical protein EBO15_37115 [Actinomadura harenae]|uniref:Uncharacterized protein n=1 Tax=Actinomadura harenae TaxID=2483351 RepID=A0A3M2LQ20_9ACTN|nr:hypothetical protein EBO15_37115 [Actinomadura harenae]
MPRSPPSTPPCPRPPPPPAPRPPPLPPVPRPSPPAPRPGSRSTPPSGVGARLVGRGPPQSGPRVPERCRVTRGLTPRGRAPAPRSSTSGRALPVQPPVQPPVQRGCGTTGPRMVPVGAVAGSGDFVSFGEGVGLGDGRVGTLRTRPSPASGSVTTAPCVVSFNQSSRRSGATVSWTGPGGEGRSRPTGRSVPASRTVTPPVSESGTYRRCGRWRSDSASADAPVVAAYTPAASRRTAPAR